MKKILLLYCFCFLALWGNAKTNSIVNCDETHASTPTDLALTESSSSALVAPITFCVDLSCVLPATAPSILGTFNGWCANCNLLSDPNNDNIWCATVNMPDGAQEYKFFTQQQGEEGLTPGSPCTVTNFGFTNRLINVVNGVPQTVTFGWESCTATCFAPPAPNVTLCVNLSCLGGVQAPSVAGTFNGWNFGANQVTDPDGDGIYCASVIMPLGANEYKFFDQLQGQEDLTPGSPCTVTNFGFTNRIINVVAGQQTVTFGWESCGANCVPPPGKPDLKITFEDPSTVTNYNLVDFAGAVSSIITDPTNAANKVVQVIKTNGALTFAGTVVGNAGLANAIPFTATQTTMGVRVWAPAAGIPVLLKIERTIGGPTAEVLATTTTAGWQILSFDFSTSTNQPFNLANIYDKLVIFFNFGASGTGQTFYFDDIVLCSEDIPVITSVLPTCYKYCADMANPTAADITFLTECPSGAEVTITDITAPGATNCPGDTYTYMYTVTDVCGRISEPVFRDFIIANDGPTISCPPFNLILDCGDENNSEYIAAHLGLAEVNTSCDLGYTLTLSHTPQDFNNIITCGSSTVVTFTAMDACGRTATCTTTITIQDNTAPTIVSVPPSVCDITNCSADVNFWFDHWKNYMINGIVAEDACDDDVAITASDTPLNTNCPNGTASTVVTFNATDFCGNVSQITGTFIVEATPSNLTIQGKVATEAQQGVGSVEVTLAGSNIANQMVETGADGLYGFNNLLAGDNYSVTPYSNDNPLNGVSSYDLVLISKHILQTQSLDSPYKMIAADINRSGSITTFDLVELRKLILHVDEEFANNTSWRFVEADFVFPNANNPFATLFPEAVFINGLTESEQHDFVGVKIGDVNESAVPNAFTGAEDRTFVDDLVFQVKDQELKAGETYEVAFRADNFESVHGYQFTVNFDKQALTFAGLRAGDLTNMTESNFGTTLLDKGVITTSWTNQEAKSLSRDAAVFYVSFTANVAVLLSEALAVNSRYTKAEAYDANLDLMAIKVRFNESDVATKDFRLYQNTPNPFKQETLIGFDLPEAGAVTVSIFDGSGRLLKQIEGDFAKGYNNISVSEDALTPGLLYYQVVTEAGTATRKMMLQQN